MPNAGGGRYSISPLCLETMGSGVFACTASSTEMDEI